MWRSATKLFQVLPLFLIKNSMSSAVTFTFGASLDRISKISSREAVARCSHPPNENPCRAIIQGRNILARTVLGARESSLAMMLAIRSWTLTCGWKISTSSFSESEQHPKLSEWAAENLQEEWGFPDNRDAKWSVQELNAILQDHLVMDKNGNSLECFGCVRWESDLYRGFMRARWRRCYPFKLPELRFYYQNPQVCYPTLIYIKLY